MIQTIYLCCIHQRQPWQPFKLPKLKQALRAIQRHTNQGNGPWRSQMICRTHSAALNRPPGGEWEFCCSSLGPLGTVPMSGKLAGGEASAEMTPTSPPLAACGRSWESHAGQGSWSRAVWFFFILPQSGCQRRSPAQGSHSLNSHTLCTVMLFRAIIIKLPYFIKYIGHFLIDRFAC